MSKDPEDKRILERMKSERELLAEFGAQLHGSDQGVSAYLASKDFSKQTVSGQGRGYFGEDLSFTAGEWKWLRPLLEELRDLRSKEKAVQDAQSQIDASRAEARALLGQLNNTRGELFLTRQECGKVHDELDPIRRAAKRYGRFGGNAVQIIQKADEDEAAYRLAREDVRALRDELEALKAAQGGQS